MREGRYEERGEDKRVFFYPLPLTHSRTHMCASEQRGKREREFIEREEDEIFSTLLCTRG